MGVVIGTIILVSLSVVSGWNLMPPGLLPSYYIYYQWKQIQFEFPNNVKVDELKKNGSYIPLNVIPTAIKVYRNRAFISTPRYKPGVPISFSSIPYNRPEFFGMPYGPGDSPVFKPFPNYAMQEEGNCNALQLVQSMELDQYGRMWIVDSGRTQVLDAKPRNLCPAKIVLVDLNNQDRIISTYEFPDSVVPRTEGLIKDIQVACTSKQDCWVYISDIEVGNLVVFNYAKNESWIVTHPYMLPDPVKANFSINGMQTSVPYGITRLGLAPRSQKFAVLYFSPLASTQIYKVNTSALQDPVRQSNPALADSDVMDIGSKPGQSDGMAMDNRGTLYYGDLPGTAVYATSLTRQTTTLGGQRKLAQSTTDLSWPDTFGFDGRGSLLLTTTKFQLYPLDMINPNEMNYRVLKFVTGTQPYNA